LTHFSVVITTVLNRVQTALNMLLSLTVTRISFSQTRNASFIALLSSVPARYQNTLEAIESDRYRARWMDTDVNDSQ
jgi:hypothetical protein